MDPRNQAEEALAQARARGAFVVTPDNAMSPMDASNTVRIPREHITSADQNGTDPNSTVVLPYPSGRAAQPQHGQQEELYTAWPTDDYEDYEQREPVLPPNPYHAQRSPEQFGPLESRATHPHQFPRPQY